MYDLSRLSIGVFSTLFIAFGLYYGVKLRKDFPNNQESNMLISENKLKSVDLKNKTLDIIYANSDLSTFSTYAQKINISQEFANDDEMTVFVPSNEAFEKYLKNNVLNENNPQELLKFLNSHIVKQKIDVNKIEGEKTFMTISGSSVVIKKSDLATTVNGKLLSSVENIGKDGIFYILDFVLVGTTLVQPLPEVQDNANPAE